MRFLSGKTIWILSPDKWGPIRISKHHYAIELAKLGNTIYFFNPPQKALSDKIVIQKTEFSNLWLVNFSFYIPGQRFQPKFFINLFVKRLIYRLKEIINNPPDVVWSFNYDLFKDLRFFKASKTILHIMDYSDTFRTNNDFFKADNIFTVTKSIAIQYQTSKIHIIPHGLNSIYEHNAQKLKENYNYHLKGFPKICLIGALLYNIDHDGIAMLIKAFPECTFDFIGPYSKKDTNIMAYIDNDIYNENNSTLEFLNLLENSKNVNLLGIVGNEKIVEFYNQYDIFLLLYRKTKDNRIYSNAHKIFEYFSTGKTIFTNVELDLEIDNLVNSAKTNLMDSFKELIEHIEYYNSKEKALQRIELALSNSYQKHIKRIEEIISL